MISDHLIGKASLAIHACEYPEWTARTALEAAADDLRAEGAREALAGLSAWLGDLAEKHPERSAHHPLMQAHIERYTTDHYPEGTDR